MNALFSVDERFLNAIMRMEDSGNIDWQIIKEKITSISDEATQNNLHSLPDFKMNYSERFNMMRGFSAALDVLKNILNAPGPLLEELKEQEDFNRAQEVIKMRGEQEEV